MSKTTSEKKSAKAAQPLREQDAAAVAAAPAGWHDLAAVAAALGLPAPRVRRLLEDAAVGGDGWREVAGGAWISPEARDRLALAVAGDSGAALELAVAVEVGAQARRPEVLSVFRLPLNPYLILAKKSPEDPPVSVRVRSQRSYRVGASITVMRTQGAAYEEVPHHRNPFLRH